MPGLFASGEIAQNRANFRLQVNIFGVNFNEQKLVKVRRTASSPLPAPPRPLTFS